MRVWEEVTDERGDSYLLKFDPPDYPEVATAAEVISTKLFYAIGYNVPENYLFYFQPEQLHLAPDAKLSTRGKKRAFKQADLDRMLEFFPVGFHEPYFGSYLQEDFALLFNEAVLELEATELAFLTKVMRFRKR